jgi:hypothetical protein
LREYIQELDVWAVERWHPHAGRLAEWLLAVEAKSWARCRLVEARALAGLDPLPPEAPCATAAAGDTEGAEVTTSVADALADSLSTCDLDASDEGLPALSIVR